MIVAIIKDGSHLVQAYADNIHDAYNTGSAMVITACRAQERVWVRSNSSGKMLGVRYSTFSGFLLYPGL